MTGSLIHDAAWRGEAPISGGPAPPQAGDPQTGAWPRMLTLPEEVETRLTDWLDDEIFRFFAERQELTRQWEKWQTQYWAEPASEAKNFPFRKAANIVIPMTAIAVEAVHARLINTLFSIEPFFALRPRSKDWIPVAKPVEKYLQAEMESSRTLRAYEFCTDALMEMIKLGTGVGKSGYKREFKKSLRTDEEGTDTEFFVESYNGSTLEHVSLANFMMRLAEKDPQSAGWCGERHRISWGQLKRMAQSGRMKPEAVEAIKHHWLDHSASDHDVTEGKLEETVEKLSKTEPMWHEEFRFTEIWCAFDVDGDGFDEEIVIDYHKASGTILSARYNWYNDLHRPYRITNYVTVEGLWTGIGIGKQNEQFQEEITTIHRQRLDNATLANMAQIIIRKNAGYGPGEPLFPGKMWFVDDVNDIAPFKLNEVYPSSYANEESVARYSEKRTGVNEVVLGLPQSGTPGTATGDLARLAEGNKRFDLVMKNVKRWLSLLGQDILANMQQFGNQQLHWLILGEDGIWVEQLLRMPSTLVSRGVFVDLSVTDSITNQELEQQQWLSLFQVVTNYYQQVIQLASMLQDPELLAQVAQRAILASDEALRRLLETFAIVDSDRFALSQEGPSGGPDGGPGEGSPSGPANGPEGNSVQAGVGGAPSTNGPNGGAAPPVGPAGG